MDKTLEENSGSGSVRDFPCRRTYSGQGTDTWYDFKRYFENVCQINGWKKEYATKILLCSLRGQAETYSYGLPLEEQSDLDMLLMRLDERFGSKNMKKMFLVDAKLKKKRRDESFRAYGQAVEDLYRKAYPDKIEFVKGKCPELNKKPSLLPLVVLMKERDSLWVDEYS